jgi:ElaB/YqjD/DUF883 family membrane-anchored ribosome-binding protein
MDQMNRSESLTADQPASSSSSFRSEPGTGNSTIETVKSTVAEKLHAAAGVIHQKAGQSQDSPVAGYAEQAAGWLDDAADYVRDVDPQRVKADVQHQVRQNPGRSLLVAGAAGLLLGFLLRR